MSILQYKKRRGKAKISYNCHVLVFNKTNKYSFVSVLKPISKETVYSCRSPFLQDKTKTEEAVLLAEKVASYLSEQKIDKIVFDRNGNLYHGRVKAFADKLRDLNIKV